MTSTTSCASFTPIWPAQGKRSNCLGISERTSVRLTSVLWINAPDRWGPIKTFIASSKFPIVAEIPQIRYSGAHVRKKAEANSTCVPRFVPISSCHSSTTINFNPSNRWTEPVIASITCSDSGVVTKICGHFFR